MYEFIEDRKASKISGDRHLHLAVLLFALALFAALEIVFPDKTIYHLITALLAGGIALIFLRKDLFKQVVVSGFVFGAFYLFVFMLITKAFPDFVPQFYTAANRWGVSIAGVPIEEVLVAFAGGMLWSALYEYVNAYRER